MWEEQLREVFQERAELPDLDEALLRDDEEGARPPLTPVPRRPSQKRALGHDGGAERLAFARALDEFAAKVRAGEMVAGALVLISDNGAVVTKSMQSRAIVKLGAARRAARRSP